MEILFNEKTCAHCGKSFVVPDTGSWVYKQKTYDGPEGQKLNYFCSWKCLNAWRSKRMGMKNSRKKLAL